MQCHSRVQVTSRVRARTPTKSAIAETTVGVFIRLSFGLLHTVFGPPRASYLSLEGGNFSVKDPYSDQLRPQSTTSAPRHTREGAYSNGKFARKPRQFMAKPACTEDEHKATEAFILWFEPCVAQATYAGETNEWSTRSYG